jgi:hypothetical protein
MSRRTSDSIGAKQNKLLVDWSDCSRFHRNRFGYRLILARGWSLYVVHEVDGLMYVYDTEHWDEWIRRIDTNLEEMFVYSDRYDPCPLLARRSLLALAGKHLTLEAFLSRI